MIIPLALFLCLTFSCQKQVEEGITEEEAKALLDSVKEIWNDGNSALVDEFYDPEYVRKRLGGLKDWYFYYILIPPIAF